MRQVAPGISPVCQVNFSVPMIAENAFIQPTSATGLRNAPMVRTRPSSTAVSLHSWDYLLYEMLTLCVSLQLPIPVWLVSSNVHSHSVVFHEAKCATVGSTVSMPKMKATAPITYRFL